MDKVRQIPINEKYRGDRMLLALSKVSQALQSTKTPGNMYLKFAETIHELGFEATILSLNDSGTHLTTTYQTRETERMKSFSKRIGFSINNFKVPIRRGGLLGQVVNSGQTIFLESRTELLLEIFPKGLQPLISRMVKKNGKQMQTIIAPLRFKEKTFGVIGVSSADLSENEIPAITVFAGQVSATMMNARAYSALQEQEQEKFRIVFDSAPDAYYINDLKGKFIDGNKQAERITGYSKEELIGKSFLKLKLLPKSQIPTAAALLAKNVLGKSTGPDEFTLIRNDGSEIEVEISTHPVRIEGKLVVLGIARDITERKQTRELLQESEDRYRTIFESVNDGIIHINKFGKLISTNDRVSEIFGYTEEDVIGKSITNLGVFDSKDLTTVLKSFGEAIRGDVKGIKEWPIRHKNGNVIPIEASARLVKKNGKVEGMVAIVRDVTERKQTEKRLREQADMIQAIVDSSLDWIWAIDLGGNHTYSNHAIEHILGYTQGELVGKPSFDLMHEEDRQMIETEFPGWISEKRGWRNLVIRWKHKDGSLRYLESSSRPTFDTKDQIIGFRGVDRDITERKQNEEKQRAIEERYRAVVENSLNGIIIVDEDFKLEYVNDPLCQVLGRSHEEIIGHDFSEFLDEESEKLVRDRYLRRQRGEEITARYEFNVLRKDGEPRRVEISSAIVRDPKGKVRTIAQLVDITERKKAEGTLKRRLDELKILQEVSSICLENMDENQTIAQVTKTIGKELFSDHFGVMLLDEEDNVLRIHPSYQGLVPDDADFEIKLGEGVTGRVAKTNKSIRIDDVAKVNNYITPKFRQSSELCVPISLNSKLFGVINAESGKQNAFTPADEQLLNTVADQLAVALQKSRLFKSEQKGRLEAEANREASEFLTMSLDLEEVLDNILDSLRKVIDSDQASIHLFEEDLIQVVAGKGFKNIDEVIGYKYSLENQLVLEIVNSKSPLVLEDTALDSRFQYYGPENPRSWMGLPLIERETVIGYLSVENNIPGTFNQRDAKLVQIFANNAAAAIVKARLFEGEKKRRLEAEIQGEISTTLTDTLDLQTVLERVLKNLQRYLEYDSAGILLQENGHLRIVATHGFENEDKINNFLFSAEIPLYQEMIKAKSVIILENAQEDDRFQGFGGIGEEEIQGWMGVPLIDQGKVFGYVTFDSKTPGKFTSEMARLAQVLVNQTSSAISKAKLFEETKLGIKRLEALHEIDQIISSSVELTFALNQIMKIIVSQLEIDAAAVLLYNPESQVARCENSFGFSTTTLTQNHIQMDSEFAGRVILERQIVRIDDLEQMNNQFSKSVGFIRENFKTYIGVPLITKGQINGVLEIFHRSPLNTNSEWDGFLQTLATQLAIAIDNSLMFENLQKSHLELTLSYDATIEGWAKTLELRDQETQGHSERVTSLTVRLGRALGLSEEELIHIRRGALLHDVGKIGIPDKILQKPSQLTEDEIKVMREHPILAYNVLSGSVFLETALDIPYSHHEKWDGTGYPRALKGETIPLAARVFAIIDVYDALRSNRPYRKAWSKEKTLKHIKGQSGIHFDPRVVEVFLKLVDTDPGFNVYDE